MSILLPSSYKANFVYKLYIGKGLNFYRSLCCLCVLQFECRTDYPFFKLISSCINKIVQYNMS